jgi:hypothetical protein
LVRSKPVIAWSGIAALFQPRSPEPLVATST